MEVRNHGRRAHTGDVLAILPEARSKRMIIFFYGEIDAAKGLLVQNYCSAQVFNFDGVIEHQHNANDTWLAMVCGAPDGRGILLG